jgi:hypothetical protein
VRVPSFPTAATVTTRTRVVLAIGLVMMALGSYIALRPLWAGTRPLSTSRWLDLAFAAFFLLRGWMNVRTGLRRRRPMPPPEADAPRQ